MFVFKRKPGPHTDDLTPGFYAKSLRPERLRSGWGIACCPKCSKLFTIGINHEVTSSGGVTPSMVCPFPPCTFHEFIRLEGWQE